MDKAIAEEPIEPVKISQEELAAREAAETERAEAEAARVREEEIQAERAKHFPKYEAPVLTSARIGFSVTGFGTPEMAVDSVHKLLFDQNGNCVYTVVKDAGPLFDSDEGRKALEQLGLALQYIHDREDKE